MSGAPLRRPRLPSLGAAPLGLSLALDAAVGELPEPLHPVVWMGRLCGRLIPPDGERTGSSALVRGAGVTGLGAVLSAAAGLGVERLARRAPRPLPAALQAGALWPLLALRELCGQAMRVADSLDDGDLDRCRAALRWLVGRPVDDLPPHLLAGAAVESVAENLADAVVAPLLYGRVAGVAGAALHRFANTADAMVGYRDSHRLGGRVAARLDDALGLAPARLAALAIAVSAPVAAGSPLGALRLWRLDGASTASPNAGRPMAAMAGALGVRLEKRGHHVLHAGGRDPRPADVVRSVRIARGATVLTLAALTAPERGRGRGRA